MNKSETIGKLGEALAKAQGKMENAKKDSKNPFFKSSYADLASCSDACKHELSENNIAVVQFPFSTENGKVGVETVLVHSSGEWMSERFELTPVKGDPQSAGSAITYARRYALCAAVGIAPEDDDGNAASGRNGHHETTLPHKDTIQDESHAESPKTKAAKAKAADPLNNKYLDGKWRSVVNFYASKDSPYKSKTLGEIEKMDNGLAKLHELARLFIPKPNPKTGLINGESYDLQDALKAFEIDRRIEKEREEYIQSHTTEMHDKDQEWDAEEVKEAK